jgi:ubiquinone/menaquinone biosynthesis C-methylase UbiE
MIQDNFKYTLTALTLKLFSISPQIYRWCGNKIAVKKRIRNGLPHYYPGRAKRFLELCEKHKAVQDGDKVLEIGTGWLHWESIVLKLFYDVEATLFDVWDNRQLKALKRYCEQFERSIAKTIDMNDAQKQRIHRLIEGISQADSFDELYQNLRFQYVVNKNGTLEQFQDESFNLIYSYNVLEHVDQKIAPQLIQDFYRVLKPGGVSIHLIDIGDHLVYFAGLHNLSKKNYVRYSDKTWHRYFENKVQYINRIQRSRWLDFYRQAGLELMAEETHLCDIATINVAGMYNHLEKQDLACKTLVVVHRKP